MARLYANENFPLPVVEELRKLGHDVLTTFDAGKAGLALPDESVLAFAVDEARVVLTLNRRHFIRLHSLTSHHCGIIVCSLDSDFIAQTHRIHGVLQASCPLEGEVKREEDEKKEQESSRRLHRGVTLITGQRTGQEPS